MRKSEEFSAHLRSAAASLATLGAILLGWQLAVALFSVPRFLVPSPLAVAQTVAGNAGHLLANAWITLGEMLLGLGAGAAAGVAIALAISRFPGAERLVMPAIVTTQTLPVFAIAPLLVIWFGFGIGSKVVMAGLIIFFPIASAFHDGLKTTDRAWLDLARGWGASPAQMLFKIRIPAALPSLASGLKVAATLAPIGAIVGEWAGASGGLGYVMLQANARMQTELVFACILILALIALTLRLTVAAACDRLVFWRGNGPST